MTWTANDLEPPLTGVVTGDNGPVDLTTASIVVVHIRRPNGTVINRDVTLGNQATAPGSWSMPLGFGDLASAGAYRMEAEVQWTTGRPQTYPQPMFQVGREIPSGPVTLPESPPGSGLFAGNLTENPPDSGLFEISV